MVASAQAIWLDTVDRALGREVQGVFVPDDFKPPKSLAGVSASGEVFLSNHSVLSTMSATTGPGRRAHPQQPGIRGAAMVT
jgi:hypothetical protein